MGKKVQQSKGTEESVVPGMSAKKHKKHHKHRHKRHKDSESAGDGGLDDSHHPPTIKLKLKIGTETMGTKSVIKSECESEMDVEVSTPDMVPVMNWDLTECEQADNFLDTSTDNFGNDMLGAKKGGRDMSDEEKEWLDALEAGTLDDNGDVKKARDVSLLTPRQRALLHGNKETLQELPSGYKSTELTAEQVQKRLQKAKRRREQAQEKREFDKKETMKRLLTKQATKAKGVKLRSHRHMHQSPGVRYINSQHGISISVPPGLPFPMQQHMPVGPPKPAVKCGAPGCDSSKRYTCAKTGIPLCSLACYKKNLSLQQRLGGHAQDDTVHITCS